MSDTSNEALLELAATHCEYWTGTTFGDVLHADIERGDLEGLQEHLKESASLMHEAEHMDAPMTDETREQLNKEGLGYEAPDTY